MPGDQDNRQASRSFAKRVMFALSGDMWFPRKQYPDLEMFDSIDEACSVYHEALRKLRWEPRPFLYWTACVTAVLSLKALFLVYGRPPYVPNEVIPLALVFIAFILGHRVFFGWHIGRSLRLRLNAHGKPVCMGCGYNLVGNVSGQCPECAAVVPPER